MESPNMIKNFTCEICEKDFSTNNYKEQHISTVHGEVKKFDCNVCNKTFGQKQELNIHFILMKSSVIFIGVQPRPMFSR